MEKVVTVRVLPDEYFVIESENPEIKGWDGAVLSYVEYLYELAQQN
jgi:hypothetical protein